MNRVSSSNEVCFDSTTMNISIHINYTDTIDYYIPRASYPLCLLELIQNLTQPYINKCEY